MAVHPLVELIHRPEGSVEFYPILAGVSHFFVIGDCLWTLILATIGGLAASWLAKRQPRPFTNKPKDQPSHKQLPHPQDADGFDSACGRY